MKTSAFKRSTLGLFDGFGMMFRGAWFIVTTPGVWGFSLVPTLIAVVVIGGVSALGIWGAVLLSNVLIANPTGGLVVALWAIRIVLGSLAIFISAPIALSLAQPLSAFALDRIAREQEKVLGLLAWSEHGLPAQMWLSLQVTFTVLLIGGPILVGLAIVIALFFVAAFVTISLKFLVVALMVAWDFLDYLLSMRGATIGSRFTFFRAHFWCALGFGLVGAFLLLILFVGLLLLLIGVVVGARFVVE